MNKEHHKSDSRLKNISEKEDASASKNADKLVEVRKKDTGEDKDNEFVVHQQPFDEQMHEPSKDQEQAGEQDKD